MKSPVTIGPPDDDQAPGVWKWRRLTDVAQLESGHTPRKTIPEYWSGGDVPWISLQDIRAANGKMISETKLMPTKLGIENSSARLLPQGTVVFSRDISVGYVAIMGREMSTTQHFANWICGDELNNHFLMYALMASRRSLVASGQGSTVGTIYMPALKELHLLVPPIVEQRRIVAKLEAVLGKVGASQQRLAKIPVLLKRFRQSVLAAACCGRLTADWREENPNLITPAVRNRDADLPEIPESWLWVKLPETGEMTRGRSRHRPRDEPSLYGGPYPFIQTGDIARSGGRITKHKQTYTEAGLAQSRLWEAGTICITIAANIAESAILTYPACFPDSVVGIIADPKIASAEYIEFFIRVARADLATFAPATAQKNINVGILNEVQVPLPPLPEQQEIVRRVERLFALADQLEARLAKAQKQVDKLTPSLLARAFAGKLVPQDPADEPAEKLLERVQVQSRQVFKNSKSKTS